MALNQRICEAAQNAAADAITALIGVSGFLDIYDGTQPDTPDTAIVGQVRLARLALSAAAFAAAAAGVAASNAISDDTTADATGTATWASFVKADGVTRIIDCSVGVAGANILLNTVSIVAGGAVSVAGYNLTVPMQGT